MIDQMTGVVEVMDEADIFDSAWVPGSHLSTPLKKALFAIRNKQGFVICGESGLGKSRLADHVSTQLLIQASKKRKGRDVYTDKPVLHIALQKKSKTRDVILDLLECLGIMEDDLPSRMNERKLEKLLFKQIRVTGVKCILFDEFQHLMRSNNVAVNSKVADFIKVLTAQTGVSIGLFGIEEGASLLRLDKQLKTRWINPYVLKPLGLDKNGEPGYFMWFLNELLAMYPRRTKEFATRDNALRFLLASEGNLRELKKMLTPLIRDTEDCPDKLLTMKDVSGVYRIIQDDDDYEEKPRFRGRNGRRVCPFRSDIDIVERYLRDASGL